MHPYVCMCACILYICYRNCKLKISRVPTKAKLGEPAYSQVLNQNKIDRQRSKSRESGSQTAMVDGVWS